MKKLMNEKKWIISFLLTICIVGMIGSQTTVQAATKVAKVTDVSVTSVNYNTVQVKWKSVAGADGYEVYRSSYKDGKYEKLETTTNKVKTKITNLGTGKTYYFWVRAYKTSGGKKIYGSNSDKVSGKCVTEAPEVVSIQMESESTASLEWKYVSGSSGYYIYRSTSQNSGYKRIATIKSKSTKKYIDEGLSKGKTYYYKVAAYQTVDGKKIEGDKSAVTKLQMKASYTISATSTPYAGNYMKNSNYSSATKNYFTILSYMELFQKLGGGELTLKKGDYKLWKPIYIPSNTTIYFKDGVTIKSTGTSGSYGLFVLADPSVMSSKQKYSKYNGVHDVKLIGDGEAVFDKEYRVHSALLIGHTKNVTIEGITFKNMNGGAHFIELDASQNVTIRNCKFTGYKETGEKKEAINLDTPDSITRGFSGTFSSCDKTPDKNITIENNEFNNLPTAIGTHMYSPGYQHTGITITGNKISNCKYYGIRMINWKNSSVTGNTFSKITSQSNDDALVFEVRGVSDITVKNNNVSKSDMFMMIKVANYSDDVIKSHPGLEDYKPVYNDVTEKDVVYNTLRSMKSSVDIYYSNKLDFSDRTYWSVKN
jgi:parallel beta-helix repeat protein